MAALIAAPQNRAEAVRPVIEKLGGSLKSGYLAFGDYDVVLIASMPSDIEAAAIAMAFAGGGALKAVKTTPLLSLEDGVEAMKKAATCGYKTAISKAKAGA
jgi:uncharacterized protein with GYD domain